jgi:hypothetical protein
MKLDGMVCGVWVGIMEAFSVMPAPWKKDEEDELQPPQDVVVVAGDEVEANFKKNKTTPNPSSASQAYGAPHFPSHFPSHIPSNIPSYIPSHSHPHCQAYCQSHILSYIPSDCLTQHVQSHRLFLCWWPGILHDICCKWYHGGPSQPRQIS